MIDFIICLVNFIVSFAGSIVSYHVKNSNISMYYACISGIMLSILWAFASRYTNLKLIVASALFSTICEIAYLAGYIYMGTKMSLYNYFGILLILLGIIFLHLEQ